MNTLSKFTQQYKLSKTLRFELKPCDAQGQPITGIESIADYKNNVLTEVVNNDRQRAKDYETVKLLIDDYHRAHIEKSLQVSQLSNGDRILELKGKTILNASEFDDAEDLYKNLSSANNDTATKDWESCQEGLRKKIKSALNCDTNLFKKELLTKSLPQFIKARGDYEEQKNVLTTFARFATYFTGFHENRKNMYVDAEQATAIPFRVINDNLPKFYQNIAILNRIEKNHPDLHEQLCDQANIKALQSLDVTSLQDLFTPKSFINIMSQTGIDAFQQIIGDTVDANREHEKGLKVLINLYTQQIEKKLTDASDDDKAELLRELRNLKKCKFISLFKQILSEREQSSYIPEGFESDAQLLSELSEYFSNLGKHKQAIQNTLSSLFPQASVELNRVYIKTERIGELSSKLYGNRQLLEEAINNLAEETHPLPEKGKNKGVLTEALQKRREQFIKKPISVQDLNTVLLDQQIREEKSEQIPTNKKLKDSASLQERLSQLLAYIDESLKELDDHARSPADKVEELTNKLLKTNTKEIHRDRRLPSAERSNGGLGYQQIALIKEALDDCLSVTQTLSHLHLVKNRKSIDLPNADPAFYAEFTDVFETFQDVTLTLYNKARNYLSKKPYKRDQFKINFDKPTLLDGWDVNKETDNLSVLFKKDGLFYLGIMKQSASKSFNYVPTINDTNAKKLETKQNLSDSIIAGDNDEHYEKMSYKLLPGASKMLLKVFFSKSRIDFFAPSEDIIRIRNTASHTKSGTPQKGFTKVDFDLNDCHKMIDFFKQSIEKHSEWREYNFKFEPTKSYPDLSAFYKSVEDQGYVISFDRIKASYIEQLITSNDLHLFQIYNKDFSKYSKGKENLHTMYWRSLFEAKNIKDVVTKLNGQAEIFFREQTLKRTETTIHKSNQPIENKNTNNPKKTSSFSYDIVKDRRFTVDKFFFHVPISLNFKAADPRFFNLKINQQLSASTTSHIIGIDRGERNLLAYCVIDQSGNIIEKGDINKIETDQGYSVDYHAKLETKEKQRDAARKSWGEIENIKELKAGYLSHVVHKVACLIEKFDASVCLEDLNFGFKRGRFKVEKQVYQKFEKALIDKLNYLVFKDKEESNPGHYLNAYQLTAPFESFQKLGKQSGILYYVTAAHTSKICPASGFINFLDLKYKSLGRSKEFFEKIESFHFNADKGRFELSFDYTKMGSLAERAPTTGQTAWRLGTHGDLRYRNVKDQQTNRWSSIKVDSTKEIADILEEFNILGGDMVDLRPQILELTKSPSKFYNKLFKALNTAFSMRQSKTGTPEDFILSPVILDDGSWFDSRNEDNAYPKDADENGAYHIALKGLWNLTKMREDEKYQKSVPPLKTIDWVPFAQQIATQKRMNR